MYLSKHFIFSNLDFIFPLELFKYILSLGCLLISRKFASIICDIWGNPLNVEGTKFLPCFFFFFRCIFADESGSISCKNMHLPLWLHERREMYKKAKVSLCCYEKELS